MSRLTECCQLFRGFKLLLSTSCFAYTPVNFYILWWNRDMILQIFQRYENYHKYDEYTLTYLIQLIRGSYWAGSQKGNITHTLMLNHFESC